MKTKQEIEQLAEKAIQLSNENIDYIEFANHDRKQWINGYIKCQENMAIENKMLGDRLWRMSNNAEDWMNKHKSTSKKLKLIEASINGSLDGIEFDNNSDVIEKSFVIDMLNDLKKLLNKQD